VVFVLPLEMNGKDFRQRWKLSRPKRCSVAVCHVQANSGSHHATNTCTIGGNRGRASQSLTLRLQPLMVLMGSYLIRRFPIIYTWDTARSESPKA